MPKTMAGLKFDYARARIQNYLDDREETREPFAIAIGMNYSSFNSFMSNDERKVPLLTLTKIAQVMGITYEKLISPLGPEDYK